MRYTEDAYHLFLAMLDVMDCHLSASSGSLADVCGTGEGSLARRGSDFRAARLVW